MSGHGKNRSGGVLPLAATAMRKAAQPPRPGNRAPGPKLRLIVRRLPPGLIESEFWAALGEEWQVGKGKIDWAAFKDGKLSKDPAKPSRPARAYLKVKDQAQLDALSLKVKATTFQDARNTSKDSCLLGPPSLEFAPYNKMATARVRHDGRQGTIDQDQEFIDFLQSLTEPLVKPSANGADADGNQEKVTTTPLVQYLKEKKANKAKEAAEKKSAKQRDSKEVKDKKASTVVVKGSPSTTTEKARVAKATQDAVRAINKSVASMQTNKQPQTPAKAETNQPAAVPPTGEEGVARKNVPTPKRERDRASATAAARIVQRDLGLSPRSPRGARNRTLPNTVTKAGTGVGGDEADSGTTDSATPSSNSASVPTPDTNSTSTPATATPPTGPRNARNTSTAASKPTPAPKRPNVSLPNPSAGAKSAFLKHANPSQGVTEELLRVAFEAFGTVTKCEIDKKKGLGYIDFQDTDTLRKAMHASPVKVGNGQVVVLENRNVKKGQQNQAGITTTTLSTANTAAAVAQSPIQKTATPAPTAPIASATASNTTSPIQTAATPATQSTPTTTTPAAPTDTPFSPVTTTTPPTAPRGGARGGGRGSIRGNPAAQRGNFTPGGRGGGPRGGFRGGRGSFGPRGGRAAAQAVAAANAGNTPPSAPALAGGATGAGGGDGK